MSKHIRLMLSSILAGGFILLSPLQSYAATLPAVNGYKISPVRTDTIVSPGQSTLVPLYLQNASNAAEDVQAVVDDFQPPQNESGNPALLLNGESAPSHGLKQFVKIQNPNFILAPGQQETVNVKIVIPLNASSGGYYGAIRFAPTGSINGKNVNLSASVASLILIVVPGNLVERLTIKSFGLTQGSESQTQHIFFSNKNINGFVSFQNSGNVQVQPFGKFTLKQGSKTINTYDINNVPLPGNVLPDSARRFTVKLDKLNWYGKYKLLGNFGYGSKGTLLTSQITFYIIPIWFIVLGIGILLLILFLIFGLPRLLRVYNRRVLARAGHHYRR